MIIKDETSENAAKCRAGDRRSPKTINSHTVTCSKLIQGGSNPRPRVVYAKFQFFAVKSFTKI